MPEAILDPAWRDRLAHDLRGPLAPLQTAAQLLAMPDLNDSQRAELAAIVSRQSTVLANMIDELGDWLSIERGRLLGKRETVELDYVLGIAAMKLGRERQPCVIFDNCKGLSLEADIRRVAQAFAAVLERRLALQNNTAPLRVVCNRISQQRVRLTFGDAVEAAAANAVRFDRAAPYSDTLGLALPIAAAIFSAHDGRIHWESSAGTCTLVCELPLAQLTGD